MDVGAFSPSSVLGCFSSTSGKDGADLTDSTQSPFFWLATRLLWTRSRDTWVPVAFVNEVRREGGSHGMYGSSGSDRSGRTDAVAAPPPILLRCSAG